MRESCSAGKTVIVVVDGLGDDPVAELGAATPLERSFAPNIHYIGTRGEIGRIETTFQGFPIESMVCIMGLLGYDPASYYPHGRASFEAMAKGIPLADDDLVLRCNLVSVDPHTGVLTDFTAGLISDSNARKVISRIKLPFRNWELYPGQSYRNVLVIRGGADEVAHIKCYPPHMHIGHKIRETLPEPEDSRARPLVAQLGEFLLDSHNQIASMDLPQDSRANMLWVWSPSTKPVWPPFHSLRGLRAACVGGLDFLQGIAMAANIHFDIVPGATGYLDTNYRAKADFTIRYIEHYDLVLTHINAADEAAHQHDYRGKVEAIEEIDRQIIGPVLHHLHKNHEGRFRIAICGDHNTRCSDGKHTDDPVPYVLYGAGIPASGVGFVGESSCKMFSPIPSLKFLDRLKESL